MSYFPGDLLQLIDATSPQTCGWDECELYGEGVTPAQQHRGSVPWGSTIVFLGIARSEEFNDGNWFYVLTHQGTGFIEAHEVKGLL